MTMFHFFFALCTGFLLSNTFHIFVINVELYLSQLLNIYTTLHQFDDLHLKGLYQFSCIHE